MSDRSITKSIGQGQRLRLALAEASVRVAREELRRCGREYRYMVLPRLRALTEAVMHLRNMS